MPHALTNREREVLDYLRAYIHEHGSSPRLEEIARHFGVTSPTAHKLLDALHRKSFIYFSRSSTSGFFIRLFEQGRPESFVEVPIVGDVDRLGIIQQPFPKLSGHFATLVQAQDPDMIFALICRADIAGASILRNDVLLCDPSKRIQAGDVAVVYLHPELPILVRAAAMTLDERRQEPESAVYFPVPGDLADQSEAQLIHWYPLALADDTQDDLQAIADRWGIPMAPLRPGMVLAVVLRLIRHLAI